MPKHARRSAAIAVMLVILASSTPAKIGARWLWSAPAPAGQALALPLIRTEITLAGVFDCVETEFGLGWATEVITLTDGGGSVYHYRMPNSGIVTGTWAYTPATRIVELRKFRWPTATVDFPNSFFNRQYIPSGNFDVTLFCGRRIDAR